MVEGSGNPLFWLHKFLDMKFMVYPLTNFRSRKHNIKARRQMKIKYKKQKKKVEGQKTKSKLEGK
jgi:hypothetical protein